MDTSRKYETPRSETKDLIIHSTTSSLSLMFVSVLLVSQVPGVNSVAWIKTAYTLGYVTVRY
jgi:hypothetical protein